jgi:hypothetical protein
MLKLLTHTALPFTHRKLSGFERDRINHLKVEQNVAGKNLVWLGLFQ